MKKTLIPIAMALFMFAAAQRETTLTNSAKGFILRFRDFRYELRNKVHHFELRSPGSKVYVASTKQGLEIYAPTIDVDAVSVLGKEPEVIRSAVASGGVRTIQTTSRGRSEITGSKATYTLKTNGSTLKVNGPVHLRTVESGRQSMNATGTALTVEFSGTNRPTALRIATMTGPVDVTMRQAPRGQGGAGNLHLTGQKMVLAQVGENRTVTLTGKVKAAGLIGPFQTSGTFSRVVMTLNAAGEVVSTEGES